MNLPGKFLFEQNLPGKFVWISPINWVDYGDPMDPDPSFDNFPIHFRYPSFELPNTLIKSKNMVTYGTPESFELASKIQARRLGAPLAASPTRTTPPQSGGKREAPSKKGSQRASGDAKHRRAHKCPKGHYWSYKHKTCMKSKF